MQIPKTIAYLKQALEEKQASAAALYVQDKGDIAALYFGETAREDDAMAKVDADSLFDLASLTKILCTVSLLFIAESEERLHFFDPIRKYFPEFTPSENEVTLLDLMNHRSGLPSGLDVLSLVDSGKIPFGNNRAVLPWICEAMLGEEEQLYSDLGFILLGFVLEDVYQKSLPEIFQEKIAQKLKLENTGFVVSPKATPLARQYGLLADKKRFVATEVCPRRKKLIQGEVHDETAYAMGGYAGHAGLFSTLGETKKCFEHLLKQLSANPEFVHSPHPEPGTFHFGLMCYPGLRAHETKAFEGAVGHTGFVGTSAWFHPLTRRIVILLANRIHPSRQDSRWIETRLQLHDILWSELP
jgi:CubicO group peptidase (beta-lactamase class C family)